VGGNVTFDGNTRQRINQLCVRDDCPCRRTHTGLTTVHGGPNQTAHGYRLAAYQYRITVYAVAASSR